VSLAQKATPEASPVAGLGGEPAFGDAILRTFGYPDVRIEVGPAGVTASSTLAAGYYLVTLSAADGNVAYLGDMQPPAGLDEQTATDLALAAARDDLAQPDWVYAGRTNTFELGVPVSFVIFLAPGDYQIAASYYQPEPGAEETMRLLPLTVTAASPASPPAQDAEPPATVTLEATDALRFLVSPDPVPAGSQVWKITNTGQEHAHHVVMSRVPDGVTAEQIVGEFGALMAGTPPAG
jgi:hypothetical protein